MPVNTHFPPLTVENYKLLPEVGPRYQLIQDDLYKDNLSTDLLPGFNLAVETIFER